jgi:hypothetical protein
MKAPVLLPRIFLAGRISPVAGSASSSLRGGSSVDEPCHVQPAEVPIGADEGRQHGRPARQHTRRLAAEIVELVAVEIGRGLEEAQARAFVRHGQAAALQIERRRRAGDVVGAVPDLPQPPPLGLAILRIVSASRLARLASRSAASFCAARHR